MSAPLMFALVDASGNAIPLRATDGGRLLVQVEGLSGINVELGSSMEISNDVGNPIPVTGPLTDTQLRAAAVPIAISAPQIGAGATGVDAPAGATGLLGWLSGIFSRLSGVLAVSGSAAPGSAPTSPPLSVSGVDAAGLKRHLLTDATGALNVIGADYVVASDGLLVEADSLQQSYAYNGDGTLNYIQVTKGPNTYRQTFSYSGGAVAGVSNWVKQ